MRFIARIAVVSSSKAKIIEPIKRDSRTHRADKKLAKARVKIENVLMKTRENHERDPYKNCYIAAKENEKDNSIIDKIHVKADKTPIKTRRIW